MLHPMIASFKPWSGTSDGAHHYDFLGVKTDPKYWPTIQALPAGPCQGQYPRFGPQLYEWVTVLGAARNTRDRFVMAELGAGYAPWLVRAAAAVRSLFSAPIHLIGVEGHALHHEWMLEHFRDNRLEPSDHTLLHGVVTPREGDYEFLETGWDNAAFDSRLKQSVRDELRTGQIHKLRGYTLDQLFAGHAVVDLVHMDIQGAEMEVVPAAMDVLSEKVRVICIGTHSEEIDRELVDLFKKSDWIPRWIYPRQSTWATFWGIISFQDGCQVWLNQRMIRRFH